MSVHGALLLLSAPAVAPHQPRPCSPTIDAAWAGTMGCGWSEHGRSALLQGQHPKHRDVRDPALLGTVERYFLEIMDIPRLQQRIDCFIFTRQFAPNVARVSSHLLRWCNMHWQATALQPCVAALNLHAQLSCGKGEHVGTASRCGSGLSAPAHKVWRQPGCSREAGCCSVHRRPLGMQ